MVLQSRKNSWQSYFQSGLFHELEQGEKECLGWKSEGGEVALLSLMLLFLLSVPLELSRRPGGEVLSLLSLLLLFLLLLLSLTWKRSCVNVVPHSTSSIPLSFLWLNILLPTRLFHIISHSPSRHCNGRNSCQSVGASIPPGNFHTLELQPNMEQWINICKFRLTYLVDHNMIDL